MEDPIPKKEHDIFEPFIYPINSKIKIPDPGHYEEKDFLEVLLSRYSETSFASPPNELIYNLLYYSCKIREIRIDEYGYLISKRVVPSAGGRHPIDILVSMPETTFSNRSLHHYNPVDHSLGKLVISKKVTTAFFSEINETINIDNAVLLWFSIQTEKTGSKYYNPESLIWRDTGALLYCIQLLATYLNLSSCPIGTLVPKTFNNLFAQDHIISGGGILVGKFVMDAQE